MYFVYPYHALSTCFSDAGDHCKVMDTRLQIFMLNGITDIFFQD